MRVVKNYRILAVYVDTHRSASDAATRDFSDYLSANSPHVADELAGGHVVQEEDHDGTMEDGRPEEHHNVLSQDEAREQDSFKATTTADNLVEMEDDHTPANEDNCDLVPTVDSISMTPPHSLWPPAKPASGGTAAPFDHNEHFLGPSRAENDPPSVHSPNMISVANESDRHGRPAMSQKRSGAPLTGNVKKKRRYNSLDEDALPETSTEFILDGSAGTFQHGQTAVVLPLEREPDTLATEIPMGRGHRSRKAPQRFVTEQVHETKNPDHGGDRHSKQAKYRTLMRRLNKLTASPSKTAAAKIWAVKLQLQALGYESTEAPEQPTSRTSRLEDIRMARPEFPGLCVKEVRPAHSAQVVIAPFEVQRTQPACVLSSAVPLAGNNVSMTGAADQSNAIVSHRMVSPSNSKLADFQPVAVLICHNCGGPAVAPWHHNAAGNTICKACHQHKSEYGGRKIGPATPVREAAFDGIRRRLPAAGGLTLDIPRASQYNSGRLSVSPRSPSYPQPTPSPGVDIHSSSDIQFAGFRQMASPSLRASAHVAFKKHMAKAAKDWQAKVDGEFHARVDEIKKYNLGPECMEQAIETWQHSRQPLIRQEIPANTVAQDGRRFSDMMLNPPLQRESSPSRMLRPFGSHTSGHGNWTQSPQASTFAEQGSVSPAVGQPVQWHDNLLVPAGQHWQQELNTPREDHSWRSPLPRSSASRIQYAGRPF